MIREFHTKRDEDDAIRQWINELTIDFDNDFNIEILEDALLMIIKMMIENEASENEYVKQLNIFRPKHDIRSYQQGKKICDDELNDGLWVIIDSIEKRDFECLAKIYFALHDLCRELRS